MLRKYFQKWDIKMNFLFALQFNLVKDKKKEIIATLKKFICAPGPL